MQGQQLFLYSLSIFILGASNFTYAKEAVTIPELEGGITASVGTFFVESSADNTAYAYYVPSNPQSSTAIHITPDYQFGIDASLGYIFTDTANSIELFYRNLDISDNESTLGSPINAKDVIENSTNNPVDGHIGYELNAFDLLIAQYVNIGEHMQMRLLGGLTYVELKQDLTSTAENYIQPNNDPLYIHAAQNNKFSGWGPRLGIDARYAFGTGIGIVGGGSIGYYLGTLNAINTENVNDLIMPDESAMITAENNLDSHGVTNLRGNLGIDYVYNFDNEERSTLGLELGYLVDYYSEATVTFPDQDPGLPLFYDVTFSGPYLNLKGVF
ncbi:MAG: Lpg1974 family pore-forming outer membrane protein [Gammaproteobacteria bacterium]|jgi:hypothetical protein